MKENRDKAGEKRIVWRCEKYYLVSCQWRGGGVGDGGARIGPDHWTLKVTTAAHIAKLNKAAFNQLQRFEQRNHLNGFHVSRQRGQQQPWILILQYLASCITHRGAVFCFDIKWQGTRVNRECWLNAGVRCHYFDNHQRTIIETLTWWHHASAPHARLLGAQPWISLSPYLTVLFWSQKSERKKSHWY